ncbi:hypothetical protein BT96DRAFT_959086 [Gymnopus androsaceus JB14]|uniref:DUF6570 domain-containing protein n=1 Tax=Gymnopus androsaceus JB14 TaxID=1447944 RepID=A0A6A4H569_9AGAR|nr:hypothetical protein BT96DRAFT_959086 [Gymnopus androsaceus JB14]
MVANVICFANPTAKVYTQLPPPRQDLDENDCIFRHKKIKYALDWLKLNHVDYYDIEISIENLNQYKDEGVSFEYEYQETESNKDSLTSAVNENSEEEEWTLTGPCPYCVHGLTAESFECLNPSQVRAVALKHLRKKEKILYVGHDETPVNTIDNPQLYAQMFPHLFPYGLGGIGNTLYKSLVKTPMSAKKHKGHLLMYHDK